MAQTLTLATGKNLRGGVAPQILELGVSPGRAAGHGFIDPAPVSSKYIEIQDL